MQQQHQQQHEEEASTHRSFAASRFSFEWIGDPADDVVPASQLRNRRSARGGREQSAPTFYSGGWRGMDDRMVQYGGAIKY
jgi:hypothetical protein